MSAFGQKRKINIHFYPHLGLSVGRIEFHPHTSRGQMETLVAVLGML